MIGKRSAVFGGLSVLVVMGIIASLVFTFAANPNQEPPGVLSADEAEVRGLELARFAGLVGDPTNVVSKLTNLEDYTMVSTGGTGQLGADAGSVGWNSDRQVWVIAFRGDVRMAMPGAGGGTFDNITIAIDASTGDLIGTDSYSEGHVLPYQ